MRVISFHLGSRGEFLSGYGYGFSSQTVSSPSPHSSGSEGPKEARGLNDKTKISPAKI